MQAKIVKYNPEKDTGYTAPLWPVAYVLANLHYVIIAIETRKGYMFHMSHEKIIYTACVDYIDAQESRAIPMQFCEAVKAGHDSFEVE